LPGTQRYYNTKQTQKLMPCLVASSLETEQALFVLHRSPHVAPYQKRVIYLTR